MKPITECEISHLESSFRRIRIDLDNTISKTRFWKHLFYFSLSGIILCSFLAIYFTFTVDPSWIPAISYFFIFVLLGLFILSIERYLTWLERSDQLCYFARPLEIVFAEAKNNLSDVQAPATPAHSGFCGQVIIDEEVSS